MIINLTIPLPVLAGGEYFRVRYRLVGSPTWTNYANQSNAPFTIDLPAGTYEIETTLIQAGGNACPSVIKQFTVLDLEEDSPCVTGEAYIEQDGRGYVLVIDYNLPSPEPCGYNVSITPAGATPVFQTYTTLPASPWRIPVPNQGYTVRIDSVTCEGRVITCFEEDVPPVSNPCIPAEISTAAIQFGTLGAVGIRLTITQSNPYSNPFTVYYAQTDNPYTGIPDSGGPVVLTAAPGTTLLEFPITPNYNVPPTNGVAIIHYEGSLSDGCGNTIKWEAFIELT